MAASGPRGFLNIAEAAQAGSHEVVAEMLERQGCDVDAQDAEGNTALHWAAWFKQDTITAKLCERGARPDIGNNSGEAPVHWAAKSSNVCALDIMTKRERGFLTKRDMDGFTPFIISAQNDNAPIMEWMYLKGVSVEEQDDWGRTALQWACYKGHRRTVQWLLSRAASVAHRDHEGMTAIHWAALKGHEQVAEMLLDVGAVRLLSVPDAAGDTPIDLAARKKNRYLVMCFHKAQLFQAVFGRPHLVRNHFANLFLLFNLGNIAVFAIVLAPGIFGPHPGAVVAWSVLMALTLLLWAHNCFADPGWIQPRTIFGQGRLIGDDPSAAFDADQPVESQMAHQDDITEELELERSGSDSYRADGELARLEGEQNKFNYQRQLLSEARKRLRQEGGAELQPLMHHMQDPRQHGVPAHAQQAQLDRAAAVLRERERRMADTVGRQRTQALLAQGGGEYLSMLDKGDFKQVCVVCRTRREMRSHHCKECGRCVQRLDHHCPWIDNCVGLGNQRSFYCFIVLLLSTIVEFYYVVTLYVSNVIWPVWQQGAFLEVLESAAHLRFGPALQPIVVLLTSMFNLVWLAFLGALVARHTAYMSVNVTTYEVLVRPLHVQRRFPKNRGKLWFCQGFGIGHCLRSCFNYWTVNTERDTADFIGETPQDSFVAPLKSKPGGGKRDRGGLGGA